MGLNGLHLKVNPMDLFGHVEPKPELRDIGNQRESVAEEKARLCKRLNEILRSTPKRLNSASVNEVRAWKISHSESLKVLKSSKSSRQELQQRIVAMSAYLE
jgi:hypothetical protein